MQSQPNTSVSFPYAQWSTFYNHVVEVCIESKIQYNQDEELIFREEDTTPKTRKALERGPPYPLQFAAERIKILTKNRLAIYEGANRSGLKPLADMFLKEWAEKLDKKITSKTGEDTSNTFNNIVPGFSAFFSAAARVQPATPTTSVAKVFEKQLKKLQLPKFHNSAEAEKEINNAVKQLLSKHILYLKLHANQEIVSIPPYASQILGNLTPSDTELFIIKNFSGAQRSIHFNDNDKIRMSDDDVLKYLNRFFNADELDISHCVRLTKRCLMEGHPNIKVINLTGTSIDPKDIDFKKFPKFERCIQAKLISSVKMSDLKSMNWIGMQQYIESADKILIKHNESGWFNDLILRFTSNPSVDAINALIALLKNSEKLEVGLIPSNLEKLVNEMFIVFRKRPVNEWKDPQSLGNSILNFIIRFNKILALDETKSPIPGILGNCIMQNLTKTLSLCDEVEVKDKRNYNMMVKTKQLRYISKEELACIRHFIITLRKFKLSGCSDVVDTLVDKIQELDSKIFSCKDEVRKERHMDVTTYALLNELYVELSYQVKGSNFFGQPFYNLKNPQTGKVLKEPQTLNLFTYAFQAETRTPGPQYKEITNHSLACAFMMNPIRKDLREKVLKHLFTTFQDYVCDSSSYPLQKIILGVIAESDIPACDADSPLKDWLLAYKGIFSEDLIDDKLKEDFFDALCNNKFGGPSIILIDALAAYHQKPGTKAEHKAKIEKALHAMGGIWLTGAVQQHASEVYKKLMTKE